MAATFMMKLVMISTKKAIPRIKTMAGACWNKVSQLTAIHLAAPMVRILSKVTGFKLKHIYELFPSGPGKGACKMAGLPKPTGCV